MDIVGLLLQALGQVKFLLILTDYFSKWVEAGAFSQVREKEVIDFIWRNIICRFNVVRETACNNGPQFIEAKKLNSLKNGISEESLLFDVTQGKMDKLNPQIRSYSTT